MKKSRRELLKQSAGVGGIIGSTSLTAAQRSKTEPVTGKIQKSSTEKVSTDEIKKLHRSVEKAYNKRFDKKLNLLVHPVNTNTQKMDAYAIVVDAEGRAERYHGLIPDPDSTAHTNSNTASETSRQDNSVDRFISTHNSADRITAQIATTENFRLWARTTNEFGSSEGGKVRMTSTLFNSTEEANLWGLASSILVIPGVNTQEGGDGLNSEATAEHRWDADAGTDPLIVDRTQPRNRDHLSFKSTRSKVSTHLNWDYTDGSGSATWRLEYQSICRLHSLEYRDLIVEDFHHSEFLGGPDATVGQTFQNIPYGGV